MATESTYKPIPRLTAEDYVRFWSKAALTANPDKCWNWQAGIEKAGYGVISINGVDYKAHRISYFLSSGINPQNNLVCHTCDNRICINPNHLYAGTHSDNMYDMVKRCKTRNFSAVAQYMQAHPEKYKKGSECNSAKLTENKVIEMRNLFSSTKISYKKLGEMYGVDISVARRIILKEIWKHV